MSVIKIKPDERATIAEALEERRVGAQVNASKRPAQPSGGRRKRRAENQKTFGSPARISDRDKSALPMRRASCWRRRPRNQTTGTSCLSMRHRLRRGEIFIALRNDNVVGHRLAPRLADWLFAIYR